MSTFIFAHRGSSGSYPENTMKAFEQAVKAGADGVTFNVQLSRDEIPVIIHDRSVNRTTNGQGPVFYYMASELKQLNAAAKQTYKSRETIPDLPEFLAWAKEHQTLRLNMEIKGYGLDHKQLIKSILPFIDQSVFAERLTISSYDHVLLYKIKRAYPALEIAALVEGAIWNPTAYLQELGAGGYHINARYASQELVRTLQDHGVHIRSFSTNDTASLKQLFLWEVEGVFTDFPTRAIHLRDNDQIDVQTRA
jgi:glycerophosphoryl diester phosphodiesterase